MNAAEFSDLVAALRELQSDRCGMCGCPSDPRLVVDHDHASGFVRGLLCHSCNNAEGRHPPLCDDSPCGICWWRKRPATAWLGWTVRYIPSWGSFGSDSLTERPLLSPWRPCDPTRAFGTVDLGEYAGYDMDSPPPFVDQSPSWSASPAVPTAAGHDVNPRPPQGVGSRTVEHGRRLPATRAPVRTIPTTDAPL